MSREDLRGRGIRPYDEKVRVDAQLCSGLTMNLLWLRVLYRSKRASSITCIYASQPMAGTLRSVWGLERHHGKPVASQMPTRLRHRQQ